MHEWGRAHARLQPSACRSLGSCSPPATMPPAGRPIPFRLAQRSAPTQTWPSPLCLPAEISVTPERAQRVELVKPYYYSSGDSSLPLCHACSKPYNYTPGGQAAQRSRGSRAEDGACRKRTAPLQQGTCPPPPFPSPAPRRRVPVCSQRQGACWSNQLGGPEGKEGGQGRGWGVGCKASVGWKSSKLLGG